jgi:hypothetical protein
VERENRTGTENLIKKGAKAKKREVAVFAFFLFLSFIFWYLNSLGKEIEAGIRYQIKYTNIPKDKVIKQSPPNDLILFLKGPGYSILKLKILPRKAPVIIDISKVNYKRAFSGKSIDYFIITSGLTKSLNVQMKSGCEITSIKPDTIFFTLERTVVNPAGLSGNLPESKKNR